MVSHRKNSGRYHAQRGSCSTDAPSSPMPQLSLGKGSRDWMIGPGKIGGCPKRQTSASAEILTSHSAEVEIGQTWGQSGQRVWAWAMDGRVTQVLPHPHAKLLVIRMKPKAAKPKTVASRQKESRQTPEINAGRIRQPRKSVQSTRLLLSALLRAFIERLKWDK